MLDLGVEGVFQGCAQLCEGVRDKPGYRLGQRGERLDLDMSLCAVVDAGEGEWFLLA